MGGGTVGCVVVEVCADARLVAERRMKARDKFFTCDLDLGKVIDF
jgi:hypothetical protein